MRQKLRYTVRRLALTSLAASLVGGCASNQPRVDSHGHAISWDGQSTRTIPGVCGPHGESLPITAAGMTPPADYDPAKQSTSRFKNRTLATVGGTAQSQPQSGTGIQQTAAYGPPGSMGQVAPAVHRGQGGMPMGPPTGGMPGGGMPGGGPGVAGFGGPGAEMLATAPPRFPLQRTQVRFTNPSGMKVAWFTQGPDGRPAFSANPLDAPGRYNFPQGAIYRLKLSNIEGRPGSEIYPTMEVVPTNPKTEAFLSHSYVPVAFTPDDFKLVAEGSYIVKVIYLPDPAFQDAASTGTEEILSTRLEPGVDPIQEALRRGSILLIVRMGGIDMEAPNSPPLNQVPPGAVAPGMNPMMNFGPQGPGPGMVPFGPPGGGPGAGAPMAPPALYTGPGGLPSMTSNMPPSMAPSMAPSGPPAISNLPRSGAVSATPVSRPGTATVTSPLPPIVPGPALR